MAKNKAAIIYDFDKTLCPKDMQEYSFIPRIGMEADEFWKLANGLASAEHMDGILACMYMMVRESRAARQPLNRESFVSLGKAIDLYPGVENWFSRMNEFAEENDLILEHYIISSGLKEIIEGCSIYPEIKEVYACEFHYDENGVADWPKNSVNYTGKTQYIFRINKGILDLSKNAELNKYVPKEERPIPFRNMIYIGDGFTDVPCMKLVREYGGTSIAVYPDQPGKTAIELINDGRVDFAMKADYRSGSRLDKTVKDILRKISITSKLENLHRKQLKDMDVD
ncbi:MAG: haloacid dehalogenase-like hydrolase [Clostridiales bacterium]|nr:haloacid dehalogenase-like hydrolase [Clostridiales bacterium]